MCLNEVINRLGDEDTQIRSKENTLHHRTEKLCRKNALPTAAERKSSLRFCSQLRPAQPRIPSAPNPALPSAHPAPPLAASTAVRDHRKVLHGAGLSRPMVTAVPNRCQEISAPSPLKDRRGEQRRRLHCAQSQERSTEGAGEAKGLGSPLHPRVG